MGVVSETGPDEYRATNFSAVLSMEQYGDGFPLLWVEILVFAESHMIDTNPIP